ncbi:MAG: ribonuclease HI, partial [Clostridia bacterium]|nr:ribonuclease HI [Clostridia bacterium]
MKHVDIFTDGACSGNPGPGGWGAILRYKGTDKCISGGEAETTNNRMELSAVIEALKLLKEPCEVILTSDSKYLTDAFLQGWVDTWRERGWRRGKEELKNPDLWERLYNLTKIHKIEFVWVKGHAGHEYNERC